MGSCSVEGPASAKGRDIFCLKRATPLPAVVARVVDETNRFSFFDKVLDREAFYDNDRGSPDIFWGPSLEGVPYLTRKLILAEIKLYPDD